MGLGGVKIEFNANAIKARIENAANKNIYPLMEQVLKDSNYFVRKDQGALEKSAINLSTPKEGIIVWNTPYAKSVYYTGTPSTDVNANASLMWFHKAQAQFGKDWTALAQKLLNKS